MPFSAATSVANQYALASMLRPPFYYPGNIAIVVSILLSLTMQTSELCPSLTAQVYRRNDWSDDSDEATTYFRAEEG